MTRLALKTSRRSAGFLRYLAASAALIAVLLVKRPHRREGRLEVVRAGRRGRLLLYMLAFNKGCETVTAATASVVIATVPVLTALMARFIHGERLKPYQWAAMAVEFLGVALLTLMDGVFSVNAGQLYLLARPCCSRVQPLAAAANQDLLGLQALRVLRVCRHGDAGGLRAAGGKRGADRDAPAACVRRGAGVFSGAAAYVAWANAFARAEKASSVSNYMFVTPLLTAILGFWMLDEVPDRSAILGGGVILTACCCSTSAARCFASSGAQPPTGRLNDPAERKGKGVLHVQGPRVCAALCCFDGRRCAHST